MERTIYYLSPDQNTPSGGIRVLYRHVDILNAAGIRARLLHHNQGFKCTWFTHATSIDYLDSVKLGPEDIIVVPEVFGQDLWDALKGFRKVVFNQNSFFTFNGTQLGSYVNRNIYADSTVIACMTVSPYISEFVRFLAPAISVMEVANYVDVNKFSPGPHKLPQIAFMPRRNATDAHQLLNLLKLRGQLNGLNVVPIDGVSQETVAGILRESAFFFAFSTQEGFGLPSAEAMAAGCIVVGYDGFGGRQFFKPEQCFPVPACDVLAFAHAASEAIDMWRYDEYRTRKMTQAARRHISETCSEERERESVLTAWNAIIG